MRYFLIALTLCQTVIAALTPLDKSVLRQAEPLVPPGIKHGVSAPKGVAVLTSLTDPAISPGPILNVQVNERMDQPWVVQSNAKFPAGIEVGGTYLVYLRARVMDSADLSGRGCANVTVQRGKPPYAKQMGTLFNPGKEWETFAFPFKAKEPIAAGEAMVQFSYGYQAQTLQIADVQLYRFPMNFDMKLLPQPLRTYDGRDANAPWRGEALERIERIRKGDLKIRVTSADGQPLAGRKVTLNLSRHHFGFGTAVAANRFMDDSPDGQKYRDMVDRNFSRVVLENDFKNVYFKKAQERPGKDFDIRKIDATINWMVERDITVRGHCLVWGNVEDWNEKALKEGRVDEVKERILDHARRVTSFASGRIDEWDAINHPVAFSRIIPEFMGPSIYADLMKEFRKMTDKPLWINEDCIDFNRGAAYEDSIKDLIARGIKIDGAGNMSHFDENRIPSVKSVGDQLDRLAALVPLVQATEYDLKTSDDALHADHLRDMLILHFAHPACTGFVIWGFWEGQHWRPQAALWKKDWTARPAVKVWQDFVNGRWHTKVTTTTNKNGEVMAEAFFGHYDVIFDDGSAPSRTVEFLPTTTTTFHIVP